MRVTIVIAGLGGGGAERVCVNLANAWAAAGREVTLLTIVMKSHHSLYPLDSRVIRDDLGWPRPARPDEDAESMAHVLRETGCEELLEDAALMAALRARVLETRPDAVVSHMDLTNMRVVAALHGTGIPVIACEHTDPMRNSLGAWERARGVLYRRARVVVASHDATTGWLTQRGIPAKTIPNALVPPAVSPRRNARRRLVTLGRLSPEKRLEMLIHAFARIAPELPEWDLEIYGEGPLRQLLTWTASTIPGRVSIKGFTHQPYDALAGADLYASASRIEGFGNAIWEALACGVPVVAMDCGAPVRTLVRDGIDGRIVQGGEHELSVALGDLMRDDVTRARLASRAGEARQRYALDTVLRQWDEVLA
jgi:GalNAc-alpha-(1->4)-GalNAc-alpha-(1->3)-diNAcBac-PP-undecaprenol alpha-1,4-N-acetyl-D-galactosaminyltransferase